MEALVADLITEGIIAQGVPIVDVVRALITMIMEKEVRVHMGMF